ncbi:MAG: hypothetical protein AB8B87_17735 [Granulosicoccus sp.]
MRKLVVIDLSSANTALFEAYERKVIPLLQKYGGRLELGVRSADGSTETHLIDFPDATQFEAFLSDPIRTSLKDEWEMSGVTSTISDVVPIDYI